MSKFYMKLGKLRVEESEKEKALHFGLEGKEGGGFFTLPLSARGVVKAAGAFGVSLAMRRLRKKLRGVGKAEKSVQKRQNRSLAQQHKSLRGLDFGKSGGFGGRKRK
ncbi:MAG: hypothetical protein IJU66_06365 [Oscillospiraceae bacterium]|nr:hypothetical protein [Oscillospiraceae bacterium]